MTMQATDIMHPTFSSQLFDRFSDAPSAWREICSKDDVAMDLRVLDVFQRTMKDQCRCWGLIVHDANGTAMGCAALALFDTEMIETNNPSVLHWLGRFRKIWPRLGKMHVLFCGLPVPSGATHLRMKPGANVQSVLAEVHRAMQKLAAEQKAALTVFKELNGESAFTESLASLGYIQGAIPPMHHLDISYTDFPAYRNALKSRYRAQVQRSQKKLETAGFELLQGRGAAFFTEHFDAHAHRLYVEVQKRAEQKLERMTLAFFREMAATLGDKALLTLIRRNGRTCAFTFAITRGAVHYNMYSGLDYALNNEGDLYFNLFYADMDAALRSGASSLHLGQTSDSFKSRLGTHTEKLFFFARARSGLLNTILKLAGPLAFPKVAEVETHDVFAKPLPKKVHPPDEKILESLRATGA